MQAPGEKLPGSSALDDFCREDGSSKEFSGELRSILMVTATTGKYWHNWPQLKVLFCFRLSQVLQEFHQSRMHVDDSASQLVRGEAFLDLLDRLLQGLDSFTSGAPFTSQRLCELLLNPTAFYVNLDKLSLAFEKLLLVTSTEPPSSDPFPSHLQSPLKTTEVQRKEEEQDGLLPEGPSVKRSLDTNGGHKEVHDDEMVDVEVIAKGPLEEMDQPSVSEMAAEPSIASETTKLEQPSNGHVDSTEDSRVDKGAKYMAIGDSNP